MDAEEKLELIKETHRIKAITLFQKLEPEARRLLKKLIESDQINYYSYNCSQDDLAKMLLAVIIQKLADTTAIRAGARENKKLFSKLLSFLYRAQRDESMKTNKKDSTLFRVTYSIDINAKNELQAAKQVYRMMQDPDSFPPTLDITNCNGKTTKIDLRNIKWQKN